LSNCTRVARFSGFISSSTVPAGKALNAASVGANTVNGPWPFRTSVSSASFRADTSVLNVELAAATSAIVPLAVAVLGVVVGEVGVWAAGWLAGVVGVADVPGKVGFTGLVGLVGICMGVVEVGLLGAVMLGAVMLGAVMLGAVMLGAVMLGVVGTVGVLGAEIGEAGAGVPEI